MLQYESLTYLKHHPSTNVTPQVGGRKVYHLYFPIICLLIGYSRAVSVGFCGAGRVVFNQFLINDFFAITAYVRWPTFVFITI